MTILALMSGKWMDKSNLQTTDYGYEEKNISRELLWAKRGVNG
jgi:hypothetical protein